MAGRQTRPPRTVTMRDPAKDATGALEDIRRHLNTAPDAYGLESELTRRTGNYPGDLFYATDTDVQYVWSDTLGWVVVASGGGGGAVTSVNTFTGAVTLDSDDISDTGKTHKFTTAADITKLASLSDFRYVHTQGVAATTWTINHSLNGYPNFTCVDSAGGEIEGDITYPTVNQTVITYLVVVDGKAYGS